MRETESRLSTNIVGYWFDNRLLSYRLTYCYYLVVNPMV